MPRGTGFPARGFGTGRTLRRPSSAIQPSAFRPMPRGTGFPARGFGTGRTLRPPPSVLRPIAWRSLYTTAVRRLPPVLTAFHAREPSGTETHRVP